MAYKQRKRSKTRTKTVGGLLEVPDLGAGMPKLKLGKVRVGRRRRRGKGFAAMVRRFHV